MNQDDKKIGELLKGNFITEEPSLDFTNSVMEKIAKMEIAAEKPFIYTPVITKLGWGMILSTLIGVVFIVVAKSTPSESAYEVSNYIPQINLDFSLFQSPVVALSVGSILLLLLVERLTKKYKTLQ